MTKREKDVLALLRAESRMAHFCGRKLKLKYAGAASFLLEYGRLMRMSPLPEGFKAMKRGHCFHNAYQMADRACVLEPDPFIYCEGYAVLACGLPVLHAWVARKDGTAHDPTWHGSGWGEGTVYVGIPFSTRFMRRMAYETKIHGILGGGNRESLMHLRKWALRGLPKDAVAQLPSCKQSVRA